MEHPYVLGIVLDSKLWVTILTINILVSFGVGGEGLHIIVHNPMRNGFLTEAGLGKESMGII